MLYNAPTRLEFLDERDNVRSQKILSKYRKIYKFHRPYGRIEATRRAIAIFKELDIFDLVRGMNTRTIKVMELSKPTYMPYWPAFSSVVREMIKFSHNYYVSAIRYSDLERKVIFVDFGAGLCKTPIIAAESRKFDVCAGIEIDEELVETARNNLRIFEKRSNGATLNSFVICGNVESQNSLEEFVQKIKSIGINPSEATLFIFNKNSYGPDVLRNSLRIVQKYFSSIVYLYQNPIHGKVLVDLGFIEFGQDDKRNTAHKNYKYNLYFKHNYGD